MRRPVPGGIVKLKYLHQSGVWPGGNPRLYVRRAGQRRVPMPDLAPSDPAFLLAYARALGMSTPPAPPAASGSIGAAVTAFLASDRYLGTSAGTRALWRRALDDIATRYGRALLADLEPRHIRADIARLTPHPATQRLKVWRAACKWWAEVGLAPRDASDGIRRPKAPSSQGHLPWTREDITAFRARWPIGSAERLAGELIFWTGARMSDAVRLTEGMIDADGWITFRQAKTGGEVSIPLSARAPDWAEPDDHLARALDARPARHLSLMVTVFGQARSVKAASAWFASAVRAAGIEGKSAHGLRKLRAIIMAENGATTHQIAAWTGHESLTEVARYSRKADKRRMIAGPGTKDESGNFSEVATRLGKPL